MATLTAPTRLTSPTLLTQAWNRPLLTNFPTLIVEIAFLSNPTDSPIWHDVSPFLRGFSTSRGRNDELGRVEAGTATVRLNNRDSRFNPENTTGSYSPNVKPIKRIRIRAIWNAITYDLFTGYIEEWPQTWNGPKDADVNLSCVDGFELLANARLAASGTRGAELSSSRIAWILDQVGFSASERDLSTGQTRVQAFTYDNPEVLTHIQDVADTERGIFFMSGAGKATFHDRHKRWKPPYTVTQSIFADYGTSTHMPYRDIVVTYSKNDIRNHFTVTRAGGVAQTAEDSSSIAAYFRRSTSLSTLQTTDAEALNLAQFLVSKYREPSLRVTQVTLAPRMEPLIWPHALGRELGDRVWIERYPTVGTGIEFGAHIEQIQHTVSKNGKNWDWTTTFSVSPAAQESYWLLGDATNGMLGISTRLGY